MTRLCIAVVAMLSICCWGVPARAEPAQPAAETAEQPAEGETEEAPGFEDFEKNDPSPEEEREEQEREADRNVISPGMQDGEPLHGMDAD